MSMLRSRVPYLTLAVVLVVLARPDAAGERSLGYYRFPAIHGDTIVFTAEGDLWRVPIAGGVAQRLTTHPAEESRAAFSPDGKTIAFSASYEGPTEVYTLALEGGMPVRQTFEGGTALVVGWTPSGELLYTTRRFATLPNPQPPSAATSSCSWTRTRHPTARRSPKGSAA